MTVAVKIVEHNAETEGELLQLRESMLSSSIVHPNVVSCLHSTGVSQESTTCTSINLMNTWQSPWPVRHSDPRSRCEPHDLSAVQIATYKVRTVRVLEESQMTDSAADGSGHIEKHDRPPDPPDPPDLSASSVRPEPPSQALLPACALLLHMQGGHSSHTGHLYATSAMAGGSCACERALMHWPVAWVRSVCMTVEGVSLQGTAGPEIDGGSQDMRETWMLLEYADRGNLDRALVQKKMMTHDKLLDMVCLRQLPEPLDVTVICLLTSLDDACPPSAQTAICHIIPCPTGHLYRMSIQPLMSLNHTAGHCVPVSD